MTRAADIDIPPGGGARKRPVLAPNDLVEAMHPFVEEFWSEVLGTSYATSFVSNHGRLDAWEQYVGDRDTLIARVVDVYGVDITKVYDQPTFEVLAFVRANTTLSRAPLSPAETAQLIGFEQDGGLADLLRELALYDDFKVVLPRVLTEILRQQFAETVIDVVELVGLPDCSVTGSRDTTGKLTSVQTVETSLPLRVTIHIGSSRYRLEMRLSLHVQGVDESRSTSWDLHLDKQVALG